MQISNLTMVPSDIAPYTYQKPPGWVTITAFLILCGFIYTGVLFLFTFKNVAENKIKRRKKYILYLVGLVLLYVLLVVLLQTGLIHTITVTGL